MVDQMTTLQESKDRLIAALDDFQEERDPCEYGHVEHTAADHLGRRLVHTFAGGGGLAIGADWDYDSAVAFIQAAEKVIRTSGMTSGMGHGGAALSGGRWIAFATKDSER